MKIKVEKTADWSDFYNVTKCPGALAIKKAFGAERVSFGDVLACVLINDQFVVYRVEGFIPFEDSEITLTEDRRCPYSIDKWDKWYATIYRVTPLK